LVEYQRPLFPEVDMRNVVMEGNAAQCKGKLSSGRYVHEIPFISSQEYSITPVQVRCFAGGMV